MAMKVSRKVAEKLARKHNVKTEEIAQCFANKEDRANYLRDTRCQHETDPPTQWFISETDYGRKLKVVFIRKNGNLEIKSAFESNEEEVRIYMKYGGINQ